MSATTTQTKSPSFAKAKDIANIYNVTTPTVFLWARQGKIPSVRFQDTVRFDIDAVRAVIEGGSK